MRSVIAVYTCVLFYSASISPNVSARLWSCPGPHDPGNKYQVNDHTSVEVYRYALTCEDEKRCNEGSLDGTAIYPPGPGAKASEGDEKDEAEKDGGSRWRWRLALPQGVQRDNGVRRGGRGQHLRCFWDHC